MFKPGERIALAALDLPATEGQWRSIVEALHGDPGFWWLDSAAVDGRLGRFSFVGAEPYLWLRARDARVEIEVLRAVRPGLARGLHRLEADPFDTARALLPRADSLVHSTRTVAGSGNPAWHEVDGRSAGLDLPFVGGAIGFFGYELAQRTLPRVVCANPDDLGLPDLALAFVDRVLAYDHARGLAWIFGLGFGSVETARGGSARDEATRASRRVADRVFARIDALLVARDAGRGAVAAAAAAAATAATATADATSDADATHGATARVDAREPAQSRHHPADDGLRSTADPSRYAKAVDVILEEIAAGNVYQANFSQRFTIPLEADPWSLYAALRRNNPAPFAAFLSLPAREEAPATAILSSSPERFLRMDALRRVESRPIKGTRPRGDDEVEDARLRRELESSEKDRAENLMIVDLVRNDLGRVCAPGSIAVPELMAVEGYAAVFQMVSTVTGELAAGRDGLDLVRANFPPGSMTGAPKRAAICLLERLESVRRGVYAGALGYLDLRGGLDLSVVIRTLVWQQGEVHLHVGGGIVADSSPEAEYLESLDKARAPLAAIEQTRARVVRGASAGRGITAADGGGAG